MNFLMTILIVLLTGCSTLSHKSINNILGKESKIVVTVTGIENETGNIIVLIHDNEYSYHNDGDLNNNDSNFFRVLELPARSPKMKVVFDGIPSGKYAINVLHDENSDKKLNRMIFPFTGMPSESYGITNNVYAWFSKAPFKNALVTIKSPITQVSINLSHHLEKITGGK